jgi:hypothetical protein
MLQGLFLDAGCQLVFNCLRRHKDSFKQEKKTALHKHLQNGRN